MFIRFVTLLFFLFPLVISATPISNAGFIPAPLWFSRAAFFAGETVRIYTVVYNGSDSDLRGTVEFLNGGVVIGSDDFSLAKGGRSQDIWIDWRAMEGEHAVTARIVRARAALSGGDEESIDLSAALTPEVRVSVDADTDKDGVGNKTDPDDDNDGVSDKDEERAGTNPLVKDTPLKKETNTDTVSYPTQSVADKAVDVATEKAADTGSTILAFTESVREKGSTLLDQKTADAREEVASIRGAVKAKPSVDAEATTALEPTTRVSRAKEIADEKAGQSIFMRVSDAVSSAFSKMTGVFGAKDTEDTQETTLSENRFPSVHTPFAYLKLFLYATLAFLFRHAIFFYLLLLIALYYLFRTLIRFIRNRG